VAIVSSLITRRKFIVAATAASLLAGCDTHPIKGFLGAMKDWNEKFEGFVYSPTRLAPELPVSDTTPESAFPAYFVSDTVPTVPQNWTLSVSGLVERELVLTLDQLQKMTRTDVRLRHHCVEGWSAVASWHGVRVSDIAKLAGLKPGVKYVEFNSFDEDYFSSWDLASAMHPQTVLAYGMNGHPLGSDHGAPLRVYSAIKLGYKMCKYLTEVNFLPNKTGGYWEDQGYDWFGGV
jgi:DMSO/TMAO reductase YedYZ molybdopterin-dependent catalytic subunit